ncbi:MAG: carboxymuconolactone decarboxylase family protein, partial [Arenibacter troitsensis]|nr:carboxymuconolactone decarboxylase family protein [Arenibacter troitsensis]
YNGCNYCLAAHTQIGKMNGFTDDQILEIRTGAASFDAKLDALAKFVRSTVENKGRAMEIAKEKFFDAGYTEANLIDVVIVIGDKTISNLIHNLADFEIDFPLAEELRTAAI